MRRVITFRQSPLVTPEAVASGAFPSRDIISPRWLRRWVTLEEKNGLPHFGIVVGMANHDTDHTERRTNCRISAIELAVLLEAARCATAVVADPFQDLNGYVFVKSHNDAIPASPAMKKAAKAAGKSIYQAAPYFRSQGSHLLIKFGAYDNRLIPVHGPHGAFRPTKNRERLIANAEFFAHGSKQGLPDKERLGEYVENLHRLFAALDASRERGGDEDVQDHAEQ